MDERGLINSLMGLHRPGGKVSNSDELDRELDPFKNQSVSQQRAARGTSTVLYQMYNDGKRSIMCMVQEDLTRSRWTDFVVGPMGSRRRHGDCHEHVTALLCIEYDGTYMPAHFD